MKAPLDRERILSAAVAIADADGAGAVTMRKLAEHLDCEAMSLYYYVADKRALLSGMVEAVVGEVVFTVMPIAVDGDWSDAVRERCLAARQVMLRHPWAPVVISAETETPAPLYGLYEQFVSTLVEAGFSYDLAHRAIHVLGPLVLGFTNELFDSGTGDDAPSEEMMEQMAEHMPHLMKMAGMDLHDSEGSLSTCDTQAEFEFTLGLALEGLERRRLALG